MPINDKFYPIERQNEQERKRLSRRILENDLEMEIERKRNPVQHRREIEPYEEPEPSELPPSRIREEQTPIRRIIWNICRPIVTVIIGVGIVAVCVKLGYDYAYGNYIAPVDAKSKDEIVVTIERNSSLETISNLLEEEGIIRNADSFKYYVGFSDMSSKLLAGTYTLTPSMTFDDIIDVLKRPTEIKKTQRLTFREGGNVDMLAELLVKDGLARDKVRMLELARTGECVKDNEFIKAVLEDNKKSALKRKYVLEGYLFPETYEVYSSSSEEAIIEKLVAQFSKIFDKKYKERAEELNMTPDEIVTLASIIEKEAKSGDFRKVSAVFHNRLDTNGKLESCATVQYFTGERKLVFSKAELDIDSPYNTYKYAGLPIGPICNPSKAAIEAALYPDEDTIKDGYKYFCLKDPVTGELAFSKTLSEHNKNVSKYQGLWKEYDAALKEQSVKE